MSEILYSPKNNWVLSTDNKEGTTRNTVKFLKLDNTPTCLDTEILQILLQAAANKVVEVIPEEELKRIADRVIAEALSSQKDFLTNEEFRTCVRHGLSAYPQTLNAYLKSNQKDLSRLFDSICNQRAEIMLQISKFWTIGLPHCFHRHCRNIWFQAHSFSWMRCH